MGVIITINYDDLTPLAQDKLIAESADLMGYHDLYGKDNDHLPEVENWVKKSFFPYDLELEISDPQA